jgi:hypothetical protein
MLGQQYWEQGDLVEQWTKRTGSLDYLSAFPLFIITPNNYIVTVSLTSVFRMQP